MKVLLLDDSEEVLDVLELLLEDVVTTKTTDPATALNLIENEDFDLLITDYNMPKSNGVEVSFEVRKVRPQLPIILFTALDKNLSHTLPLNKISDLHFVGDKDMTQLMTVVQTLSKRYTLPFGTKE